MTGEKHHRVNVENFVRENTRMIIKHSVEQPNATTRSNRPYKCKDCNKEYDTFQALGGHRASHRSPKPETLSGGRGVESPETMKPKLHECKICKKGFEIGQSLGGHMRKHWKGRVKGGGNNIVAKDLSSSSGSSSSSSSIARRRAKGKVVLEYDLNLMPDENEKNNAGGLKQESSSKGS